jgi:hypothetical protein
MWKDNKKGVNKMFREVKLKITKPMYSPHTTPYPQILNQEINKIRPSSCTKTNIHLFTPLIVLIKLNL